MLGVMFENSEACKFIGQHLMSLASSSALTRSNVFSILNFIRFLRENCISPEDFINNINSGTWLRTSRGGMAPGKSVLYCQEWSAASQISGIPFIDEDYYGKEILSFKTELELLGVMVTFGQNHQLVFDNLKSSSGFSSLTVEAILLVLECARISQSRDKLIKLLKDKKCLKTNLGYRCPSDCFLFDPDSEWGCILQVFSSFPLIDETFYGRNILSFKNELKQIGVVVDFEEATKKFASTFKQLASLSCFKRENVLSFLDCYRKLKKMKVRFPSDLKKCVKETKWLRTRLGDYRSPNECILYSADWKPISQISLLPFIDDSENFYGKEIRAYKKELGCMNVVTKLKDGAMFVVSCLHLPPTPSNIAPKSAFSLLKCIQNLQEGRKAFPQGFDKKVAQKWLKMRFGYRSPDKCLLFDAEWSPYLKLDDGPFIDSDFYGSDFKLYEKELNALGVIVDVEKGCQLLADYLVFHLDFDTICRIYACLYDFSWKDDNEACKRIWIPRDKDNGEWVSPKECVLYDNTNLFGLQLNVLEKYYEEKLLAFFAKNFLVKAHPSIDDYCKLWKLWEGSGHCLSHDECCFFWEFVVNNWDLKTEKILSDNLLKLPVHSTSGGISLLDKHSVFIADDLYLKELFETCASRPLFVWYPHSTMKSLPRNKLLEIFSKTGVRTLSESVQKDVSTVDDIKKIQVNPREVLISRGLFRLILGFLADPVLKIDVERRHKAVNHLLEVTVFKTLKPITIRYSLSLPSADTINVKTSQMIRWERQNSIFLMKKMDRSGGHKNAIEYAYHFSEVVAEGGAMRK